MPSELGVLAEQIVTTIESCIYSLLVLLTPVHMTYLMTNPPQVIIVITTSYTITSYNSIRTRSIRTSSIRSSYIMILSLAQPLSRTTMDQTMAHEDVARKVVAVIVAVLVAVIDIEGWTAAVFEIEWCSVAVIVASLLPQ